jgi:hypothetical protein
MSLLKVKKIDFVTSLQVVESLQGILGPLNIIDEIYRFKLFKKEMTFTACYNCFYCFNKKSIDLNPLSIDVIRKIIEGEVFNIDLVKFNSKGGSREPYAQHTPYGYVDNYYTKYSYSNIIYEDQYSKEWAIINSFYRFNPFIVKFIDLTLGRMFYYYDKAKEPYLIKSAPLFTN